MKKKVVRVTCGALLLLCALTAAVSGKEAEKSRAIRVRLSVVANERIRGVINSYMAAELRRLGDVAVTDRDPQWHLAVTAIELNRSGCSRVAISTVILAPVSRTVKQALIRIQEQDGTLPPELRKLKVPQLIEIKASWLRADVDTAISGLCRGIIADFDTQFLQPERAGNRP